MEVFGLIAFVLVLSYSSNINMLEKKIKLLKRNYKGVNEMSKLISDLKGQRCIIRYELNPLSGKKESIEYDIIDLDDEWVKVSFMDKKGIKKTKLIRIENITDVELL